MGPPGDELLCETRTYRGQLRQRYHRSHTPLWRLRQASAATQERRDPCNGEALSGARLAARPARPLSLTLFPDIVDLFPLSIALGYFVVSIQIITLDQAWRSISYRLVLCVACSFGPGKALTNTGVADFAGVALLSLQGLGSFGFLLAIHLFTSLLTSIVSNSAAVITIYSVLRSVSVPGVTSEQMMVCMLLGASTDFMTPIGYQTNLMVYKRGGYAFSDYARVGVGLTIVVGCVVSGASLAFM